MKRDRRPAILAAGALAVVAWTGTGRVASGEGPASEAYAWKNVQMVGGGFVTGIRPGTTGARMIARVDSVQPRRP